MQEACRKDVKRTFGVLQARFAAVANPSRLWSQEEMSLVMRACVILHNMIVQDERDLNLQNEYENPGTATILDPTNNAIAAFATFVERFNNIRDADTHHQLRNDLIDHLWNLKGDEEE